MKGKQKNVTAITVAVILTLAIRPECPAYGQGNVTKESDMVFDQLKGKKDVEAELVDTIEVTLISAVVPSDVDSIVNPLIEFNTVARPGGQVVSPEGPPIIGHSVVSAKLEVASAAPISGTGLLFSGRFPGGPVQDLTLVRVIAETETPGRVTLVFSGWNQAYTSSRRLEQYTTCLGRVGIPVAEIGTEKRADPQICGRATADFYGVYQFTVKPTLKVSIVKAR